MKRGKLIGTTTGGSTGNPLEITLPGDVHAMICTKKIDILMERYLLE